MAPKASAKSLMTAQLVAEVAATAPATERPSVPPGFLALRHDQIVPDPLNARKTFDPESIAQLAETMFTHGLQQPPVVAAATTEATGDVEDIRTVFQLVAGERRWRAWHLLIDQGRWTKDHIEICRLETADERTRMEAALIENLQRVDLNHMEAGEAFEELGRRFHLSNKVIAEKIGRTPEYVQQHRRLTGLNEEGRESVRTGHLSMHEALRVLAVPKPKDLTPAQMLLLAEIAHRAAAFRPPENYYYGQTECSPDVVSGDLTQLKQLSIVSGPSQHWKTKRHYLSFGHQVRQFFDGPLAPFRKAGTEADDLLRRLQDETLHPAALDALRVSGVVYTNWFLNGPFELTEAAKAELAREKIANAEQRDQNKKKKAEEKARMAAADALRDRWLSRDWHLLGQDLQAALAEAKGNGPFRSDGRGAVFGASGRRIMVPCWETGENAPLIASLVATALNLGLQLMSGDATDDELAELSAEIAQDREEDLEEVGA